MSSATSSTPSETTPSSTTPATSVALTTTTSTPVSVSTTPSIIISLAVYQSLLGPRQLQELGATTSHFTFSPNEDEVTVVSAQPVDTTQYDCYWIPRPNTVISRPTTPDFLSPLMTNSTTIFASDDENDEDVEDVDEVFWRNAPVSVVPSVPKLMALLTRI